MSESPINLRTVEHPRGTWIYDGDQPIAFWFHRGLLLDIWKFGPKEEPLACPTEIPRIYDMNSYFNMHAMLRWEVDNRSSPPQQIEQRWLALSTPTAISLTALVAGGFLGATNGLSSLWSLTPATSPSLCPNSGPRAGARPTLTMCFARCWTERGRGYNGDNTHI